MRCPSQARIVETFGTTPLAAGRIRALAKLVDDGAELEAYINEHCPETAAYARSCHGDPYNTGIWRVTMALHAVNKLLDGCGVEGLGPGRNGDHALPYEYVNFGDPYTTTLVFKRDSDNLFIGCWGDIAERHPTW